MLIIDENIFFFALNQKKNLLPFYQRKLKVLPLFYEDILMCRETVIICFEHFTCLVQVGRNIVAQKKLLEVLYLSFSH